MGDGAFLSGQWSSVGFTRRRNVFGTRRYNCAPSRVFSVALSFVIVVVRAVEDDRATDCATGRGAYRLLWSVVAGLTKGFDGFIREPKVAGRAFAF